jgi:hypothetical protein
MQQNGRISHPTHLIRSRLLGAMTGTLRARLYPVTKVTPHANVSKEDGNMTPFLRRELV